MKAKHKSFGKGNDRRKSLTASSHDTVVSPKEINNWIDYVDVDKHPVIVGMLLGIVIVCIGYILMRFGE